LITYCIGALIHPCTLHPGDRFILSIHGEVVHSEKVTALAAISHWAYVDIPGVGNAYFVGNEKLVDFLAERFPDAKRRKNPKTKKTKNEEKSQNDLTKADL
jgi:hypothetical protein